MAKRYKVTRNVNVYQEETTYVEADSAEQAEQIAEASPDRYDWALRSSSQEDTDYTAEEEPSQS